MSDFFVPLDAVLAGFLLFSQEWKGMKKGLPEKKVYQSGTVAFSGICGSLGK
ncbi:hypothetical protein J23TS9_00550 [Paenibacillus sp. J23TS9]|uniref:hypothetical protein n=1 Tax=Paenibacillus sp. J23TS9 TaxID=2807193 RepID=UPI001B11B4CB|nr:hypothetical protein [Paenibacillus sp. J23TS9]GIP24925.1 hypothetical protein J23TS9_00550 [Paenibacillus sp. J23TS9]